MNDFTRILGETIDSYVGLRRSLGYSFNKQGAILRRLLRYVEQSSCEGPLTQALAIAFVMASGGTPGGRACRLAVLRCFAQYLSVHDPRTEAIDSRALPRGRTVAPPRILDDGELARLMTAANQVSPRHPQRGRTLFALVGLLAASGLRSGEALRLDRADVDLARGIVYVRQTKFRKDRLVPVHSTTAAQLRLYAAERDAFFPETTSPAFFLSLRGGRMSSGALQVAFRQACVLAGLGAGSPKVLRPHDLRHRFAVERLASWHREGRNVQALLPLLATYLGHARYSDTAWYVTGTAELLGAAAKRAFEPAGGQP